MGAKILKNLFENELKGKTKIMVTHYLSLLNRFGRVIYLQDGKIMLDGPYNVVNIDPGFREFAMMEAQEISKK